MYGQFRLYTSKMADNGKCDRMMTPARSIRVLVFIVVCSTCIWLTRRVSPLFLDNVEMLLHKRLLNPIDSPVISDIQTTSEYAGDSDNPDDPVHIATNVKLEGAKGEHADVHKPETMSDVQDNVRTKDTMKVKKCEKRLPDTIIIGVMKSGTGAFANFLSYHPQVAIKGTGISLAFFSTTKNYNRGLDWYRRQLPCSRPDQVAVEKSPQYWGSRLVPKRVHAMNASVRLILLVREPVARAMSDYLQGKEWKQKDFFSDTFEQSVIDANGKLDEDIRPIQLSIYYRVMQRWLEYFSMSQILVIDGDRFRVDPVHELARAEDFLGIKHYVTKDKFVYNEDKKVYCIKGWDCLGKGKSRPHPDIDPAVRANMTAFFRPHNEMFYKLVGQRFDW